MSSSLFGLIELLGVFGVILAVAAWQLWEWRQWRRQRDRPADEVRPPDAGAVRPPPPSDRR